MLRYQKVNKKEFDHLFDVIIKIASDYFENAMANDFTDTISEATYFKQAKFDMDELFYDIGKDVIRVKWRDKDRISGYIKLFDQLTSLAMKYEEYEIAIDMRKAQVMFIKIANRDYDKFADELTELTEFDGYER